MKRHLLAVLMLAFASLIWADAPVFKKLADFNNLFHGDKVVITMEYQSVLYGLNGEETTPKADVLTLNADGALEDPETNLVFIASQNGDGWEFLLAKDQTKKLYILSSGNAVKVGSPSTGKYATVWKLHPIYNYLYAVLPGNTPPARSDTCLLGVYHDDVKQFKQYSLIASGVGKKINDETFALFVNSPTGDPTLPKYDITLAAVEGGTLSCPYPKAGEGAGIPVEVTPDKGYDYVEESLCIVYNDGIQDITLHASEGQFVMPPFPVTVTAEFEGRHPLATIDFTGSNRWNLPEERKEELQSFTFDGLTIAAAGGYYWKSESDGYLMLGKKNAALTLPVFADKEIARIEVAGQENASAKTEMNILVDGTPVSTQTVGSQETNIYLIAQSARAANTQFDLTVLSEDNARIPYIDIYASVPGAPETPTVDIPEGLYTAAQNVTLSCATLGADIYYTLDGSRPTKSSSLFSSPIAVSSSVTIRAVAILNDIRSELLRAAYVIADVEHDGSQLNPYSIADVQKLNSPGWKAWVHGYIINGFDPNITVRELSPESETAIAIADLENETEKDNMVFVELTSKTVRDALNVVKHPENIGKEVWIYGVLANYGGKPGLSKASKYTFTEPTAIENNPVETDSNAQTLKPVKLFKQNRLLIVVDGKTYNVQGIRVE